MLLIQLKESTGQKRNQYVIKQRNVFNSIKEMNRLRKEVNRLLKEWQIFT